MAAAVAARRRAVVLQRRATTMAAAAVTAALDTQPAHPGVAGDSVESGGDGGAPSSWCFFFGRGGYMESAQQEFALPAEFLLRGFRFDDSVR